MRMRRSSSCVECAQAECVTSSRFVFSHSRATALNSPSSNEIFKSCLSRSRRDEGRSFQFQLHKETLAHSERSPTRITYHHPTPRTIRSRASSCIGTMARERRARGEGIGGEGLEWRTRWQQWLRTVYVDSRSAVNDSNPFGNNGLRSNEWQGCALWHQCDVTLEWTALHCCLWHMDGLLQQAIRRALLLSPRNMRTGYNVNC